MRFAPIVWGIALLLAALPGVQASGQGRHVESLDRNWKFTRGDVPGAAQPEFDDGGWRKLDVPHDWSIEGPIQQDSPAGQGGAFLPTGIGWYRKRFPLPPADRSRRVWVEFDGVMANSEVWINGFALGKRPNGYVGFRYEVTGHLRFGDADPNLLAVRADNSAQPASRWYAGAGIYRHVRLIVTDPVSIPSGGIFVTTSQTTEASATVHLQCRVENRSPAPKYFSLRMTLLSPAGRVERTMETPLQSAAVGQTISITQELALLKPERWTLEQPRLYRAVVTVLKDRTPLDSNTVVFGIRDAHFDAATGFWLNGKNIKIKGVGLHQDAGALGMAVPRSVWERRLAKLKTFGVNAIRTAHTPFSPDFLSACDRLGLLVMDEMFDCWTVGKAPYDYHLVFREWAERDARDTVVRDRNHPCIVLYSIGNEIHDTPNATLARGILTSLRDVVHAADPTRPVTQALFRPNASHDYTDGLADLLDVVGQNYRENELLAAHSDRQERKIIGTENGHDRRVWLALRDHPAYAGQFLWTGIDYLGEAKRWPAISADFGLFGRTLVPRPRAYERKSWWSETPTISLVRRTAPSSRTPTDPGYEPFQPANQTLFPDWTPRNAAPHSESVEVYSNCEQVELFLNGQSLGVQPLHADASPRLWNVAFAPGILRAVGRTATGEMVSSTLQTAGKPTQLLATTDRPRLIPDWEEVAFVTVQVADAKGVLIPDAHDNIAFTVTGPGTLVAVDNGDLTSHEPFHAAERKAFQGQCLAILRATASTGRITVTATAVGLPPVSLSLQAAPRGGGAAVP